MADHIMKDGNGGAKPPQRGPMRVPLPVKERAERGGPDGHAGMAALQASAICDRLDNLKEHLPHQYGRVYAFAALLSDRLKGGDMISQAGFAAACEHLISDLGTGIDSRTGEPVGSYLIGYPTRLLDKMASDITDAVCPQDFAERANRIKTESAEGKKEWILPR